MEQPATMFNELKLYSKLFFVITVIFTVLLYLISVILEPALFYFTAEGWNTSRLYLIKLPVWILNIPITIDVEIEAGAVFLLLWIAFALSFVAAWKLRENFHKVIKEAVTQPMGKLFRSSLFAMPIINSMALIAVIMIQSLQEAGGIPTGTAPLPSDPFYAILTLSYAAVVEEACFRIIPIGAFIIIYLFVTRRKAAQLSFVEKIKLFFMSIVFPDRAKKMVGAKTVEEHGVLRGISLGEWGMLAFTTVVFGLAHFDPGVSWEIGKISSAAFSGLVIALCYLVYGSHAAIIMHWFFNVYIDTYNLVTEFYPIVSPFVYTIWYMSIILGLLGWLVTSILWFRKLMGAIGKGRNRQEETTAGLTISPQ
jgi:hypothetical protein